MDDLISRQAAIKAIEDLQDCYNGFSDTYDKACIIGVIEEVPPMIVRCKDCKFFRRYGFRLEYADCIKFDFYDTTEDGFCSWGERREDGKRDNS